MKQNSLIGIVMVLKILSNVTFMSILVIHDIQMFHSVCLDISVCHHLQNDQHQ